MDPEQQHYYDLFIAAAANTPACPESFTGRGIVTCGSLRFLPYLWLMVHSLRYYGCELPVELWHMKDETNPAMEELFAPLNVRFIDAGDLQWNSHDKNIRNPHGLKPYSLLNSSFREIIFIDADNAVYRDPTFIFSSSEYIQKRAVFWPDTDSVHTAAERGLNAFREAYGVGNNGFEFESGQIAIDKVDCWKALNLTNYLNLNNTYYYRYLFGDKETFRLAFDYLKTPYHWISARPSIYTTDELYALIQHWDDGTDLFFHQVGMSKYHYFEPTLSNHRVPNVPEEFLETILEELRIKWAKILPLRERMGYACDGVYWKLLKSRATRDKLRPAVRAVKSLLGKNNH